MKILLTAINAKYIHSNLAVYDLKAYAEVFANPEAKENIRKIGIYLQDQQTSAVVRGKIAKKNLRLIPR